MEHWLFGEFGLGSPSVARLAALCFHANKIIPPPAETSAEWLCHELVWHGLGGGDGGDRNDRGGGGSTRLGYIVHAQDIVILLRLLIVALKNIFNMILL